jgi:hypothetical protein
LGRREENRKTNLRAELTSFVGKDADVAAVRELIAEHRLTTLIGPGGSGKTRLATETARTLLGDLPDGAWLVELASIGADADVAQSALAALGLRDALLGGAPNAEPMDRLIAAIRQREAREGHSDDNRNGYRTAQHGGHDVTGQDGTAGDIHNLEPVDDALRHVGVHRYRSGRQPVADGQQDQTSCCVFDVVFADIECVAEHVHEHQHDHDRHQSPVEYRDRIPKDVLEVATQHDPRIGQRG